MGKNTYSREEISAGIKSARQLIQATKKSIEKRNKYIAALNARLTTAGEREKERLEVEIKRAQSEIATTLQYCRLIEKNLAVIEEYNLDLPDDLEHAHSTMSILNTITESLMDHNVSTDIMLGTIEQRIESFNTCGKIDHMFDPNIAFSPLKVDFSDDRNAMSSSQVVNGGADRPIGGARRITRRTKESDFLVVLNSLLDQCDDYHSYITQRAKWNRSLKTRKKQRCVNELDRIINHDQHKATQLRIENILTYLNANRTTIKSDDDSMGEKLLKLVDYVACIILFPIYPVARVGFSFFFHGQAKFWETKTDLFCERINELEQLNEGCKLYSR